MARDVQIVEQLALVEDRRLGEFKYFGSPSPRMRPLNATIRERMS